MRSKIAVVPMEVDRSFSEDRQTPRTGTKPMKDYTCSFLYDSLYPLLVTMRTFGLYNSRHTGGSLRYLTLINCIIPGVVILNTLARNCIAFKYVDGFGLLLFVSLTSVIWIIWCFCGYLTCLRVWCQESKAPSYFRSFEAVLNSCAHHHECFRWILRRRAWVLAGIGTGFVALNLVLISFLIFSSDIMAGMRNPQEVYNSFPQWGKTFTDATLAVSQVYISAAWIFPVFFVHCISYALRLELQSFNTALSAAITDEGKFEGDLETFRVRHQVIARLIEKADDLLSFQVSITLACSLGLQIFLIYSVLWDSSVSTNLWSILAYVYWIVMGFAFCALVLYDGASINEAAHQSLTRLHDIKLQKHSNIRDLTEITVFLNKLSGPPIGLTAIGLFVIDKPTILTTIGMFLTYFVIVVQFRMPTSTGDASANATLT